VEISTKKKRVSAQHTEDAPHKAPAGKEERGWNKIVIADPESRKRSKRKVRAATLRELSSPRRAVEAHRAVAPFREEVASRIDQRKTTKSPLKGKGKERGRR